MVSNKGSSNKKNISNSALSEIHPVDAHVGHRLRQRRTILGFSQTKLAEAIGVTFQQVQKYEQGSNRIGASRLHMVSKVLDAPISYFFDEMPSEVETDDVEQPRIELIGLTEGISFDGTMSRRKTLELVKYFYKITNPNTRERVFGLIKAMAMDNNEKNN